MYTKELILGCLVGIISLILIKLCFSHLIKRKIILGVAVFIINIVGITCISYNSEYGLFERLMNQIEDVEYAIYDSVIYDRVVPKQSILYEMQPKQDREEVTPQTDLGLETETEPILDDVSLEVETLVMEGEYLNNKVVDLEEKNEELYAGLTVALSLIQTLKNDINNIKEEEKHGKIHSFIVGGVIPLLVGLKDEIKICILKLLGKRKDIKLSKRRKGR